MPATYHVRITPQAAHDLQDISAYITLDSPDNAARLIQRLLNAIESLDVFPHRFKEVDPSIRSMPVRPYLVRYHVDDRRMAVTVLQIRHGARLHP